MSELQSKYIRDLCAKYPPISKEEEERLFAMYHAGDRRAANKIMLHHTRLAWRVALRFEKSCGSFEEAFSEACLGITLAIPKFDPNRGARFVTAAQYFAVDAVVKFIENNQAPVRLPASQKVRTIIRRARQINQELDIGDPSSVELFKKLAKGQGVSEDSFNATVAALSTAPSRDNGVTDGASTLLDNLLDPNPSQEGNLIDAETKRLLRNAIDLVLEKQTPRNKQIFERRFLSEEPESVMKIAADNNVSRAWVQKINEGILAQIKDVVRIIETPKSSATFRKSPAIKMIAYASM